MIPKTTKERLAMTSLKKVDDWDKELWYLSHSTQKRNLIYLLQLREFLKNLEHFYLIDRGLGAIYKYNILRIESDLIENYLFCTLKQFGIVIKSKMPTATGLINKARNRNLISKKLAKKARIVVDFRNDLHPSKQEELHTKSTPKVFILSSLCIEELLLEIRNAFTPKGMEKVLIKRCQYCEHGYTNIGDFCLSCGEYNYG